MSRSGASIREASLPAGSEGSKPLLKIAAAKRILKHLIAVLGTCENLFDARDAGPRVRRNDLRQRQGLDVRVVNELLDEADLPCGFALDRHTAEQEARCLSVADERPQSCDVRRWITDFELGRGDAEDSVLACNHAIAGQCERDASAEAATVDRRNSGDRQLIQSRKQSRHYPP